MVNPLAFVPVILVIVSPRDVQVVLDGCVADEQQPGPGRPVSFSSPGGQYL